MVNRKKTRRSLALPTSLVLLAGLAGGLAEVVWVAAYGVISPVSAANIAREVTSSIAPNLVQSPNAVMIGLGIHLLLSLVVGFGFARVVWPRLSHRRSAAIFASALATLAVLWAINFFAVLPMLHPTFVTLLPYAVTFISKALFALAMAAVLTGVRPLVPVHA
ncbi:MAG: hypothetical protein HY308_18005 [Gammaproteobacteria bacterium]|nr:hypothetical protein [Gammaproteobacteria bacterium]